MSFTGALVLILIASGALPAPDQEPATRAEALRQARLARQTTLAPYQPNALERGMAVAEGRLLPWFQRDGLYGKFGSLTTGSGTAVGFGYRDRSLVNGLGSLNLWVAGSMKRYWAADAAVHYPLVPGDEIAIDVHARRYAYPREQFFGVGPDSARRAASSYTHRGDAFGAEVVARPARPVRVGGGVGVLRPRIDPGRDSSLPSIEQQFLEFEAPGLTGQPDFLRSTAFLEYDYRRPLNARRGGYYRLDLARYDDRDGGGFSFSRTTLDLRQFVSILAERRVFAGRLWMATTDPIDGGAVPFYLMPALGGNDTLRGFRQVRFRGPHALLLQGEYRWEIWSGLDAALFYDAGKVANRRADLNLRDLERDYGFGFRFNTDNGVIIRVDAAFGSRDGKHLHVVFGGIF
jgi:hypothetical protein